MFELSLIILQGALAAGLLFVSLLLLVMVRQIGLIAQRIPKAEDSPGTSPLEPGTMIPVREFTTYDLKGAVRFLPEMTEGALLVFTSFSCPLCRQLLQGLGDCPQDVRRRLVLFMLDRGIERRYTRLVRKLRLESLPMIEAMDLSDPFRIRRAPFVYVVNGEGTVLEATALAAADELVALARRHFGVTILKEENPHVRREIPPGPAGRAGAPASDANVPEALTP